MDLITVLEIIENTILILAAVGVLTIACWMLMFLIARIYYFFKKRR